MDIGRQHAFHQLRSSAIQRLAVWIAIADVADAGIDQSAWNENGATRIGDDVADGDVEKAFFAHITIRITWFTDKTNALSNEHAAP